MNIFTTLPKFLSLAWELHRYNKNAPALDQARAEQDWEREREIMLKASTLFAESISAKYKIEYEIIGEENIPAQGPVLVVANHQSYADILAIFYALRNKLAIGFIAKSEFENIKIFAKSIKYTRSLFINRGDARKAIKTLNQAADFMNDGFSFAIFPEGTRSHHREMGEFKPGSFKFAQKSKASILPITLDGGYHLFEETGSYHPCKIRIVIHPIVKYGEMDRKAQNQANIDIENTIKQGLIDYEPV